MRIMQESVSLHNLILTTSMLQHLFQSSAHVYSMIFSTLQWIEAMQNHLVGVASEEMHHAKFFAINGWGSTYLSLHHEYYTCTQICEVDNNL